MGLGTIARDGVSYPVEEERIPQELEQLSFDRGRNVRLEVEEVEIGLSIDFCALRSWHLVQALEDVWRKVRKGKRIGFVIGGFGARYVDWVYLGGSKLEGFCNQADLLLRTGGEEVVEGPFLRHCLNIWVDELHPVHLH